MSLIALKAAGALVVPPTPKGFVQLVESSIKGTAIYRYALDTDVEIDVRAPRSTRRAELLEYLKGVRVASALEWERSAGAP